MINCFQFCVHLAFNFNLRRYNVVAKHAGYRVVEVNASDDRGAEALKSKVGWCKLKPAETRVESPLVS
jgi:hypothetical protein